MNKFWKKHGTKVLGFLVMLVSFIATQKEKITPHLSPSGAFWFELAMSFYDYSMLGAGALIMKRGWTNSKVLQGGLIIPPPAPETLR